MAAIDEQRRAAAAALLAEARLDESDCGEVTASEPEDWNSDDEPPKDHVGDEQTCSRDGRVKKIIRKIGRGLEQPGQNDIVHVRYKALPSVAAEQRHADQPVGDLVDCEVSMGEDKLPLAVEFAVRCMRLGERALVTAPAAYAAHASPLCGRRLRSRGAGRLPPINGNTVGGKNSRKLRFLPAAPPELANATKSAAAAEAGVNSEGTASPAAAAQSTEKAPPFQAEVELVGIQVVSILTEDGRVQKQVVVEGSRSRRTPRLGDLVTYSVEPAPLRSAGVEPTPASAQPSCQTVVLDAGSLPRDLEHVLLSMREGERCVARLYTDSCAEDGSRAASVGHAPQQERRLLVTMHRWRRRDVVAMPLLGAGHGAAPEKAEALVDAPSIRRAELCPGPMRLTHAIEDGSMVLVGLAPCAGRGGAVHSAAESGAALGAPLFLLSWCMGQGSVPGYLETAVGTMRLVESAAFDVPAAALVLAPAGPAFEGQTPLRQLHVAELQPLLAALLVEEDGGDAGSTLTGCADAEASAVEGHACPQRPQRPFTLPSNWTDAGASVSWTDLRVDGGTTSTAGTVSFRLALLAATEAPDVCLLVDAEQQDFVDRERARGNALARSGRYAEAKAAYCRALDAVRRTPIYKAIFPTEHGRITGAYTRDPCQAECPDPFAVMSEEELEKRKSCFVALHLNSALCAAKGGCPTDARRHASIVLGAEPSNAKALFRRGSAALQQGDLAEAVADLQRAAELQPQDRAVREELRLAKTRSEQMRRKEKAMFANAFQAEQKRQPATEATLQTQERATEAAPEPVVAGQPRIVAEPVSVERVGAPETSAAPGASRLLHFARLLRALLSYTPVCRPCLREEANEHDENSAA